MNIARWHACSQQCRLGGFNHGLRTTNEHFIHAFGREQRFNEILHFLCVNPALQQIDLLRLAGEDVDQRQAIRKPVLEVLQRLIEHHTGHAPVAVHQGEFGFGLLFQRRCHH